MSRCIFNDLNVDAVFDDACPRGLISVQFARRLGRFGESQEIVGTVGAEYCGAFLTTQASFVVCSNVSHDVVIGMNWIGLWKAVMSDRREVRVVPDEPVGDRDLLTGFNEGESIEDNVTGVSTSSDGSTSLTGRKEVDDATDMCLRTRSQSMIRDIVCGNSVSGVRTYDATAFVT